MDSDTQITLFEDIITTIASSTTYEAVLDRWKIDIYGVPNATLALELIAYGIHPRLDDDTDIPLMPDEYHNILVKGGVVLALKHNNDEFTVELQEQEACIRKMIDDNNRENDRLEGIQIPRMRGSISRYPLRNY